MLALRPWKIWPGDQAIPRSRDVERLIWLNCVARDMAAILGGGMVFGGCCVGSSEW